MLDIDRDEFVSVAGEGPCVLRVEATLDVGADSGPNPDDVHSPRSNDVDAPFSNDVDPLDAYAALTDRGHHSGTPQECTESGGYTFLLESAEKVASSDPDGAFAPSPEERHARFSFVGYDPAAVVTVDPDGTSVDVLDEQYEGLLSVNGGDTLEKLRSILPDVDLRRFPERDRQHLDGGLVGFLAYDAVYDLWLEEVGLERPESRFPDAQFVLTTKTLVFDHAEGTLSLVFTPLVDGSVDPGARYDAIRTEVERITDLLVEVTPAETGGFRQVAEEAGSQSAYEDAVERAREAVYAGDIYQGVLSRTRQLYGDIDPLGLYDALRDINPSPYMYLLDYGDRTIVGASPETLVSVGNRTIVSNPIAGTCPRGNSPVEDRRLAGEMLADDKERAEHTMLVDLARNDVRRVAKPGSVRVQEFMNVLKYSHVQHIESTVTGRLASEYDAFDAVRASFPAGTLSGAPKIRAMEIIDDLEPEPRGVYGGGVGYVSWQDDADFAIVIRSATIEDVNGPDAPRRITVQAGAGIVADSRPTAEYEETEKKMNAVIAALQRIEVSDKPQKRVPERESDTSGEVSR